MLDKKVNAKEALEWMEKGGEAYMERNGPIRMVGGKLVLSDTTFDPPFSIAVQACWYLVPKKFKLFEIRPRQKLYSKREGYLMKRASLTGGGDIYIESLSGGCGEEAYYKPCYLISREELTEAVWTADPPQY